MPAGVHPSSSILLIAPDAELLKILCRSVPLSTLDVCPSFEKALEILPVASYQLMICQYQASLLNKHALLALSRLHNPLAPFVVTMSGKDFSFVQHAIDHGVLGVLDGVRTTEDVLRTVRPLLWLYQLRHSLARRTQWLIDFRAQLRNNPVERKRQPVIENRLLCEQALVAIEDGMQTLRIHTGDLMSDAKERMLHFSREKANLMNTERVTASELFH